MIGSDPRSVAGRPKSTGELLGQVFTPTQIARAMADELLAHRPSHPLVILDPAVGPGTFPRAFAETGRLLPKDRMILYDVDAVMADQTTRECVDLPCECQVLVEDYLRGNCGAVFDMAILNPPYVRQEWIDNKSEYGSLFAARYGLRVPGVSNLYVYFLAKVVKEVRPGGTFACLVYDSWQSTKFGRWLAQLLADECTISERCL